MLKRARVLNDALQNIILETDKDNPEIGVLRIRHANLYCKWAIADATMINPAFDVIRQHLRETSMLDPDNTITLQLQTMLAEMYSLNKQKKEAQVLFERIEKNAQEHFGELDAQTQTASTNLAHFYVTNGLTRQGEAKYLKMLPTQRDKFGLQHPVTQMILLDLRKLMEVEGRYWQALGFSMELYQGQSQPNKYALSALATLKQTRELAAKAGVQWMGWSLGAW